MKIREVLARTVLSLVCIVLALIPVWLYLLARHIFEPEGFWQQFVVFGVGAYFLGGFQVLLIIALLVSMWWVWVTKIRLGFWGY